MFGMLYNNAGTVGTYVVHILQLLTDGYYEDRGDGGYDSEIISALLSISFAVLH
jgi:hypothetical protein